MKKADKFIWTEDMEKDFVELKKEFTAGKIPAYPDFDSAEPFILTTDRSTVTETRWNRTFYRMLW